eukprot:355705-Chlamydomonas_euryale.AAC.1
MAAQRRPALAAVWKGCQRAAAAAAAQAGGYQAAPSGHRFRAAAACPHPLGGVAAGAAGAAVIARSAAALPALPALPAAAAAAAAAAVFAYSVAALPAAGGGGGVSAAQTMEAPAPVAPPPCPSASCDCTLSLARCTAAYSSSRARMEGSMAAEGDPGRSCSAAAAAAAGRGGGDSSAAAAEASSAAIARAGDDRECRRRWLWRGGGSAPNEETPDARNGAPPPPPPASPRLVTGRAADSRSSSCGLAVAAIIDGVAAARGAAHASAPLPLRVNILRFPASRLRPRRRGSKPQQRAGGSPFHLARIVKGRVALRSTGMPHTAVASNALVTVVVGGRAPRAATPAARPGGLKGGQWTIGRPHIALDAATFRGGRRAVRCRAAAWSLHGRQGRRPWQGGRLTWLRCCCCCGSCWC